METLLLKEAIEYAERPKVGEWKMALFEQKNNFPDPGKIESIWVYEECPG